VGSKETRQIYLPLPEVRKSFDRMRNIHSDYIKFFHAYVLQSHMFPKENWRSVTRDIAKLLHGCQEKKWGKKRHVTTGKSKISTCSGNLSLSSSERILT
jgi:hypothetical protein